MNENKITAGARIGSMILDHIIMTLLIMIVAMPALIATFNNTLADDALSQTISFDWSTYLMLFGLSLYFNKDMIQGKSIAKRILKQEIVDIKTGEVASALKCLIRNLAIVIWPIEIIVVLINPSRRIGDFIAGTKVVLISYGRNSKPRVDIKIVVTSLFLGFFILLIGSSMMNGKLFDREAEKIKYVSSSYNENLSLQIANHLNKAHSKYLINTDIKVYDKMNDDSLKYILASFYLKQNYIDDPLFGSIQNELFDAMFQIIPRNQFVLEGKFIYESETFKKSTSTTYDWRVFE